MDDRILFEFSNSSIETKTIQASDAHSFLNPEASSTMLVLEPALVVLVFV